MLICFIYIALREAVGARQPELAFRQNISEIVIHNDYKFEEYYAITKDGYILTVFRVNHRKTKSGAPVVFMQHGVVDSADAWLVHTEEFSPAFNLAREGYDVWLGNNRGNIYSRSHLRLDEKRDAEEFYDYSWSEMGKYDLPAQIQLALDKTQMKKLTYIGHSQGST